jgi:uncharacterized membrane protein
MQVIPTRAHGIIDYLTGILLIAAPWVFGFADGGAAQWTAILVGVVVLLSSLMTDYELSVANVIPLPVHLGLDMVSGLFLAVSPWLFGFADLIYWPHLLVGLMEIVIACLTHRTRDHPREMHAAR